MRHWMFLPLLLALCPLLFADEARLTPSTSADTIDIIYPRPSRDEDLETWYPLILLKKALSHSQLDYSLRHTNNVMVQSRALKELAIGKNLTVTWTMTNQEREQDLLPVRVPIYKGLYGWRLLLTQAQRIEELQGYKNPERFSKLVYLQGHDWPDTEVLKENGFTVSTAVSYEALFNMLLKSRGDVFPRSIIEINWELDHRSDKDEFAVVPHIALHYPSAMYFFFNKKDKDLAKAVEQGLMLMHENGEFTQLFEQFFANEIAKAKLTEKHIIKLENTQLPSLTPLNNSQLWFSPYAAANKS